MGRDSLFPIKFATHRTFDKSLHRDEEVAGTKQT